MEMADLSSVFNSVSSASKSLGGEVSTTAISGAALVAGATTATGTSLLPSEVQSQTIRIQQSGDKSTIDGVNQSDRKQIDPNPDNKVPRLYGNLTTSGVIIDAQKPSANTILYAIVLSECDRDRFDFANNTANDASFTIEKVYWNNYRCTIPGIMNPPITVGHGSKVTLLTNLEDGTNADIAAANVINIYAWAGNASANAQVFPTYNPGDAARQNAYDIFPTWTSANTMEDLFFAVVEVDALNTTLDATANIEINAPGDFRFSLTTHGHHDASGTYDEDKLHNPAYALWDYLTSDRYGVGLANVDIDTASLVEWGEHCDEKIRYGSATSNATLVFPGSTSPTSYTFPAGAPVASGFVWNMGRWEIGGFINTQETVVRNIGEICKAGMGTFTYDNRTGLFKVLVNRKATDSEKANAFVFNDDNIISSIVYNTTDIYSLYNFAEINFPNWDIRDESDYLFVETPTADKLSNEPISKMGFSINTVNTRPRAAQIANITLQQSRVASIATFTGDHSTLQVDVGDFVKVTDGAKGWTNKFFRVMRIVESETVGDITCNFVCMEYEDTPFEDIIYYDAVKQSDAPGLGTMSILTAENELSFDDYVTSFTPLPGNVFVMDNPLSGSGNIVYPGNGVVISSVTTSSAAASTDAGNGFDGANWETGNESWLSVPTPRRTAIATPDPEYNYVILNLENQDYSQANVLMYHDINTGITLDSAGQVTEYRNSETDQGNSVNTSSYTAIKLNKVNSGTYRMRLQYVNTEQVPVRVSQTYTSGNIVINDRRPTGNAFTNTYGTGTDVTQTQTLSNLSHTPNSFYNLATPLQFSLSNTQKAEYTFTANVTPNWTSIESYSNIGFSPTGNVTFVNNANNNSHAFSFNAGGFEYFGESAMNNSGINGDVQTFTGTVSFAPGDYGLDQNWYPARANVTAMGYKRGSVSTDVTFDDYDFRLFSKSPYYRTIT
jgi:hypothetical protein